MVCQLEMRRNYQFFSPLFENAFLPVAQWPDPEEVGEHNSIWQQPLTQQLCVAYLVDGNTIWFINKTHLKLLQEEFKVELQLIFG